MGSAKDVMELFAERDIRQYFSSFDGWGVAPVKGTPACVPLYRAARGKWAGVEEAFVAVSFSKKPGDDIVSALDQLPGSQRSRAKMYLLTPQAADTSAVPPHIRVLLMSAFAYTGSELVWLTRKKNSQEFCREESVQPAAP